MEDHDLFWRCKLEGYVNTEYLDAWLDNERFARFDGYQSAVVIEYTQRLKRLTTGSHSISILVRPEQNPTQNPIYLVGDKDKKYVEYPIFSIPGYDYGISFNNSRALSYQFWTDRTKHNYMWANRYESQWSWVTVTIDDDEKIARFYLNGKEITDRDGRGSKSPLKYDGRLRSYGSKHWYLGSSPTQVDQPSRFFKGDIAKFMFWDRSLDSNEVQTLHESLPKKGLKLDVDFNNNDFTKKLVHLFHLELLEDFIKIPLHTLPHRRKGKFDCIEHPDEGLINGEWAKRETTARNERKYILEMQQGKHNYKVDGYNSLNFELVSIDDYMDNVKMINVKL
jgi:hypothetical protein